MVKYDGIVCILLGTIAYAWFNVADGHWWPETYYLASVQMRTALHEVFPFRSEAALLADFVCRSGSF